METHRRLMLIVAAGGMVLLALAAYGALVMSRNEGDIAPIVVVNPDHSEEERAILARAEQQRKPSYSIRDGQEYGYQEERQSGAAAAKVQMYRYLGQVGEKYQVGIREGETVVVFESRPPFEFAKVYSFASGQLLQVETWKLEQNAIASLALKDALYGNMQQYRGTQSGRNGHFMLDASARRIVFIADN